MATIYLRRPIYLISSNPSLTTVRSIFKSLKSRSSYTRPAQRRVLLLFACSNRSGSENPCYTVARIRAESPTSAQTLFRLQPIFNEQTPRSRLPVIACKIRNSVRPSPAVWHWKLRVRFRSHWTSSFSFWGRSKFSQGGGRGRGGGDDVAESTETRDFGSSINGQHRRQRCIKSALRVRVKIPNPYFRSLQGARPPPSTSSSSPRKTGSLIRGRGPRLNARGGG